MRATTASSCVRRPRQSARLLTFWLAKAKLERGTFDDAAGRPNIPLGTMQRDRLLPILGELGISDRNYRALKVLPLVCVAWAEGEPSEPTRRYLHVVAERRLRVGDEGLALVRRWMYRRPTAEYFAKGLRILRTLAALPDDWEFDPGELPGLLVLAEAVARTKGYEPGSPTAITNAEERVLAYIGRVLGVEHGTSWAALLRELDEEPAPSSRAA